MWRQLKKTEDNKIFLFIFLKKEKEKPFLLIKTNKNMRFYDEEKLKKNYYIFKVLVVRHNKNK